MYISSATHLGSAIAGLVMEATYGMNITSPADHFLQAAEEAVEVTKRALVPGTFLVDTLPIRASPEGSQQCHASTHDSCQSSTSLSGFPERGLKDSLRRPVSNSIGL